MLLSASGFAAGPQLGPANGADESKALQCQWPAAATCAIPAYKTAHEAAHKLMQQQCQLAVLGRSHRQAAKSGPVVEAGCQGSRSQPLTLLMYAGATRGSSRMLAV